MSARPYLRIDVQCVIEDGWAETAVSVVKVGAEYRSVCDVDDCTWEWRSSLLPVAVTTAVSHVRLVHGVEWDQG